MFQPITGHHQGVKVFYIDFTSVVQFYKQLVHPHTSTIHRSSKWILVLLLPAVKILGNVFTGFYKRLKLHIYCYKQIKGSPVLYAVITSYHISTGKPQPTCDLFLRSVKVTSAVVRTALT